MSFFANLALDWRFLPVFGVGTRIWEDRAVEMTIAKLLVKIHRVVCAAIVHIRIVFAPYKVKVGNGALLTKIYFGNR